MTTKHFYKGPAYTHFEGDNCSDGVAPTGADKLEKYKSKSKATIYGIPEVSGAMACFESDILQLRYSKLDPYGKAWYKHQDRIRMEFVERIAAWKDTELMKLKVKHAAEMSILDQEITSLKAKGKTELIAELEDMFGSFLKHASPTATVTIPLHVITDRINQIKENNHEG